MEREAGLSSTLRADREIGGARMRRKATGRAWSTVAALCAALAAQQQASGQQRGDSGGPPPAAVVVDAVRLERLEARREVVGELRAVRRSRLAVRRSGLTVEVAVELGDTVAAGQTLVRLDDRDAKLDLQRAQALLAQRKAETSRREAELEQAQRDVQRLLALVRKGSASQNELDDAMTAEAVATAQLEQARAQQLQAKVETQQAQARLGDMTVRAPFAGVVAAKLTEVGQWAREGDAVIDLVALDPIDAWLEAPQRVAARLIALGLDPTKVSVQDEATGTQREAISLAVSPVADPQSRNVEVRARLANPSGLLRPGMSAVGLLPEGRVAPTLTVHKDAMLLDAAGSFVYVVRNGRAAPVRVRALFAVGDRVAVSTEELQAGDLVVVEGNERLFPGQPVAPQPMTSAPSAATTRAPSAAAPDSRHGGAER